MTVRGWIEILGTALLLGAIGSYVVAREDRIKMQATIDAQNQVIKTNQSQIDTINKQIAQRDADYQKQTQDLTKQFQGISTQQLATLFSQKASLPVPITITTPAATPGNPNPPTQVVIPQSDLPATTAYVQACEQCKLDVAKTQADLADRTKQQAAADAQITALKNERDVAVTAAKGGSFLQRFGRALKWFAIGAGSGAAIVCGTGHCK